MVDNLPSITDESVSPTISRYSPSLAKAAEGNAERGESFDQPTRTRSPRPSASDLFSSGEEPETGPEKLVWTPVSQNGRHTASDDDADKDVYRYSTVGHEADSADHTARRTSTGRNDPVMEMVHRETRTPEKLFLLDASLSLPTPATASEPTILSRHPERPDRKLLPDYKHRHPVDEDDTLPQHLRRLQLPVVTVIEGRGKAGSLSRRILAASAFPLILLQTSLPLAASLFIAAP